MDLSKTAPATTQAGRTGPDTAFAGQSHDPRTDAWECRLQAISASVAGFRIGKDRARRPGAARGECAGAAPDRGQRARRARDPHRCMSAARETLLCRSSSLRFCAASLLVCATRFPQADAGGHFMVTFDSTGYFTPVPQRDVPGARNNGAKGAYMSDEQVQGDGAVDDALTRTAEVVGGTLGSTTRFVSETAQTAAAATTAMAQSAVTTAKAARSKAKTGRVAARRRARGVVKKAKRTVKATRRVAKKTVRKARRVARRVTASRAKTAKAKGVLARARKAMKKTAKRR
jgi:hypothetical protein